MPLDRRQFTGKLTRGVVVGGLAAAVPAAGSAAASAEPSEPEDESPAQRLLDHLVRLDPHDYTPQQLDELRRQIDGHQQRSKTLREYPLANHDEPATVFQPWRRGE